MKKTLLVLLVLFISTCQIAAKHGERNRDSKHKAHKNRGNHGKRRKLYKVKLHKHSAYKMNKNPRKLPFPPKKIKSDALVAFSSTPQIDAPRMLITNFSKPTEAEYRYPQQNTITAPGPPNMSILPSKLVSSEAEENTDMSREEAIANARKLIQDQSGTGDNPAMPIKLQIPKENLAPKRHRKLPDFLKDTQPPFPLIHNPLMPGAKPAPPITLQLKDDNNMKVMRNTLRESEFSVYEIQVDNLQQRIVNEIRRFKEEFASTNDRVEEEMKHISDLAEELKNKYKQH